MFRGRSGIAGQRHDVGLYRPPYARRYGLVSDLGGCGLAPAQRLAQPLDGKRVAHRSMVAKQVGDSLGDSEHWYRRASYLLALDAARRSCSSGKRAMRTGG